jgi:hypothetical protein
MRRIPVAALAALTLGAFGAAAAGVLQMRAAAQGRPIIVGSVYNAGLAPGEVLRLSAFNPHPSRPGVVHFQVFAGDGTLACRSGPVAVPPLATVFVDLPRESPHLLRLPGDPGTARVQLGVLAASPPMPGRVGGAPVPSAVPGLELVAADTGRTTVSWTFGGWSVFDISDPSDPDDPV